MKGSNRTTCIHEHSKIVKTNQHQKNDTRFLRIFPWFIKHTQDSSLRRSSFHFFSFHPFFSHHVYQFQIASINHEQPSQPHLFFSSTWPRAPHDPVGHGNVPPILAKPWQLAAHLVESQAPAIKGCSMMKKILRGTVRNLR